MEAENEVRRVTALVTAPFSPGELKKLDEQKLVGICIRAMALLRESRAYTGVQKRAIVLEVLKNVVRNVTHSENKAFLNGSIDRLFPHFIDSAVFISKQEVKFHLDKDKCSCCGFY